MKHYFLMLFALIAIQLQAQNQFDLSYYLTQNSSYNTNIPTPESVLGHKIGEWHVTHDKLVEYMKVIASASDRISIEDRGKTFEGRPIVLLTITSPENHKKIDALKEAHFNLTEVNKSNSLAVEEMPLVVYQGFSIHGNEPSGANASLVLAYYLAAVQGNEIETLLKNTIILLDPSLNPDGLQRFAYWANTNKSDFLNVDSNDREFHEVWPGGRTNHYWFDLNRDWLPVQLPESKARIETFRSWMPNILTDHHEMGSNSTFFFQPGVQSRVHPLTPIENQQLTKEIGNYHAKAFDKIGSLYYTEENYDDFYYGKGSTYPDVNGAVGILFEQGSSRGHAQQTENGVLTFPFTIKNQFTAALSTLEAAENMRVSLLNYQRNFFKNVSKENSKKPIKAIVFGDEKDVAKTVHLAEILKRHKIEIYKPKADFTSNGVNFKKESSFMVPTNQKNSRLLQAMFEKRTTFQDSLFYDISAWTFPLAFNVNYAELKNTSEIGDLVTNLKLKEGKVSNKSTYAYVMEWQEYYAPKALNLLLQKGIRAKVGMKPFLVDGKSYDYGTILIPVQNQQLNINDLFSFLNEVAENCHLNIDGVTTGLTEGIDLGSNHFELINKQKVALLVGNGISSYDAGEIWHLFDQRYRMNITKLDVDYLNRVDLAEYTTIIVSNISGKINENFNKKLQDWVQKGGVLIGFENAVKLFADSKLINLEFITPKVTAKNISFEEKNDFFGGQVIGGAIFETILDRSHPINFGYSNTTLAMFRTNKIFIKPDESSFNNPIKYSNNPLLSGYISKTNLDALKNTVPFQVKRNGNGRVVVFTDNTNFRGFWFGTNKLLMNAVFFAKTM
ncbi:M14 family metallopeptidase [Lutibacter sp.]|uniref:M14 family metallopeptidase n=1 Tax=Lutibacter sp. TaxID=1925666 RepID=UPI001A2C6AC7|nr:M14 family metallopeptidase [Lutibacter sp.]MBI9041449.1 zinc carboxypeptidase [Lutibacter sp.]